MRENPEYLLWMDLETTGSKEEIEEILEVGAVVTNANLDIIAADQWVVYPKNEMRLLRMDPVVVDMHSDSGLLRTLLKMKPTVQIDRVDFLVREFVKPYLINGKIPLAGSGVAHFDMRFIVKYMPTTFRALNFAPYDIGSVRRWFRLAGIENDIDDGKTHRALDDVMTHIKEARAYMNILRKVDAT